MRPLCDSELPICRRSHAACRSHLLSARSGGPIRKTCKLLFHAFFCFYVQKQQRNGIVRSLCTQLFLLMLLQALLDENYQNSTKWKFRIVLMAPLQACRISHQQNLEITFTTLPAVTAAKRPESSKIGESSVPRGLRFRRFCYFHSPK